MPTEEQAPEEEPEAEDEISAIPRMSDEGIRDFVDDLLSGRVFTDKQAPDESSIGQIFMPLMLGAATNLEPVIDDVGCIYEYMEKALPQTVNGYPVFASFRIMHKDDWDIVLETYNHEKTRRETIPVVRKDSEGD